MDVARSNGNSNSDVEKKNKHKRRNRSAKQIERARKYRERKGYLANVRNTGLCDPTHGSTRNNTILVNESAQRIDTEPTNPPFQNASLYIQGPTESYPPAYLCSGMLLHETWNMTNVEAIVKAPISNLRATADEFIPASAKKIDFVLTAKGKDNKIIETKIRQENHIRTESNDNTTPDRTDSHKKLTEDEINDNTNIETNDTKEKHVEADGNDNTIHGRIDSHKELIADEINHTTNIEGNNTEEKHIMHEDKEKTSLESKYSQEEHITTESKQDLNLDTDNKHEDMNTQILESNDTHTHSNTTEGEDNMINTLEFVITAEDEANAIYESSSEENIIPDGNGTHDDDIIVEDILLTENIAADADERDIFGILGVFASSSIHGVLNATAKCASNSTEDKDFGYVYFTLANLLE